MRVVTDIEGWSDYAQGCVFIGAFILAVFVVWMILIGLFFCCGQRTVGILSGRRLRDENKTWKHSLYRSIQLSSCVFSLMAGLMFLVKVTSSLEDTFDSVRGGIGGVADIARNVTSLADKIIEAGAETIPIRDTAIGLLNEGVCNSFEGGNGMTINFDEKALKVVDTLSGLADFSQDEFIILRNQFQNEFTDAETEINLVVDQAQNYARASYYAISIIIVSFLLSMGGYMAWFGPKFRTYFVLQTWILLPLYFVVLVLTVVVAAALSAVLTVNSDICSPNPESFIQGIMETLNLDEYPQQIADFYIINGCRGEFEGLNVVGSLVDDLKDGNQVVIDLKLILDDSQKEFETMCDGDEGSLDGFKSSLSSVSNALSLLIFAAEDARNLLECKPINSMYEDFFHEGVCTSLPDTLYWMFVTMMLVVTFGMLILTLRSALVPSLTENEPENHYYTVSEPHYENPRENFADDDEKSIIGDAEDLIEDPKLPLPEGPSVDNEAASGSHGKGGEKFKDEE